MRGSGFCKHWGEAFFFAPVRLQNAVSRAAPLRVLPRVPNQAARGLYADRFRHCVRAPLCFCDLSVSATQSPKNVQSVNECETPHHGDRTPLFVGDWW